MTEPQKREPSAAEQVREIADRQIEAIRLMLCPTESDVELLDDGTLDTVLRLGYEEYRYDLETAACYRDEAGTLDLEEFVSDQWDDIQESARERFYEYGLSFDYVVCDDGANYWCYLISTGGPGTEIRFYADPGRYGLDMHRAEFWFLPWFDGAHVVVTRDDTVAALWEQFSECGTAAHVRDEATKTPTLTRWREDR